MSNGLRSSLHPASAQGRLDRWQAFGAAFDAQMIVGDLAEGSDSLLDAEYRNAIDGLVAAQVRLARVQLARASSAIPL